MATRTKSKSKSAKGDVPRPVPRKLDPADIDRARTTARPWDRKVRYTSGDYFVHAVFGVGLVTEVRDDQMVCLFEGGETRTLIHAR